MGEVAAATRGGTSREFVIDGLQGDVGCAASDFSCCDSNGFTSIIIF